MRLYTDTPTKPDTDTLTARYTRVRATAAQVAKQLHEAGTSLKYSHDNPNELMARLEK